MSRCRTSRARHVFGYQLIDLNDRLGSYILVSQLNLSEARNFLNRADDPAFGDLRKLITTDLVKQAYLEYTAVTDTEPPTHQFRWGMRAIHEASKLTVLEFVCKVRTGVSFQSDDFV
ncbi:hypothetical protein HPB47_001532 [Ixodes persulcatus]|uniref:Uncharacterized protein n=1 Tax=Ixodes persulcatus TaxID=34615 RepID=A0AC60PQ68_IXOPE|nr:hypothetical protein HPB47_001532 [Ixodes persulcatus]